MYPKVDFTLWTTVISIEGVMLVGSLYILISLTYNFVNLYRHRRKNSQSWFVGHSPLCLNALLIWFCVTCVLRNTLAMAVFFAPITKDLDYSQCKILEQLYQTLDAIGQFFLYLFLWLRQFSLYNKNHLSRFASTRFLRFNWFILFLILAGFVSGIVSFSLLLKKEKFSVINGTNACYYTVTADGDYALIYSVDTATVFFQASLIGMFVHILRKQQREVKNWVGQVPSRSSIIVRRLVRYSTMSAIICIVTDIVTTVEDIMLRKRVVQLVLHFIWDIDFMVNLICTIFCLPHWKVLLFPWHKPSKKNSSIENSHSNTFSPNTVT